MKKTNYTSNGRDFKISDFIVIDGIGLCENTSCAPSYTRVYASKATAGYNGRVGDKICIPSRRNVRDAVRADWDFFNVSEFGINFKA